MQINGRSKAITNMVGGGDGGGLIAFTGCKVVSANSIGRTRFDGSGSRDPDVPLSPTPHTSLFMLVELEGRDIGTGENAMTLAGFRQMPGIIFTICTWRHRVEIRDVSQRGRHWQNELKSGNT